MKVHELKKYLEQHYVNLDDDAEIFVCHDDYREVGGVEAIAGALIIYSGYRAKDFNEAMNKAWDAAHLVNKEEKRILHCVDERHGTPCPQPCNACKEEGCDPSKVEYISEGGSTCCPWRTLHTLTKKC